ncbi:MAG: hypothetical protein MJA82_20730 [Clostridia bacterium]|nr:hypothetical protein [Clostridia bacterium]
MEWIILFFGNWIIFLLLVDWRGLKINIWSGLLAILAATVVDFCNTMHGRYMINRPVICVLKSSLFFLIGPVFVIGTLFAQYHPKKRWLIILNVLVIFTLYSFVELTLVARGAVEYVKWNFLDSVLVNISVITMLSWFSIVVLKKWGIRR